MLGDGQPLGRFVQVGEEGGKGYGVQEAATWPPGQGRCRSVAGGDQWAITGRACGPPLEGAPGERVGESGQG